MAESDRKFSISWKHTTGYDSPLFNLAADSVGELQQNLTEFFSSGLHDKLLDAIIESQRRFKAKRGDSAPAQQTQQQSQQAPPPEDPWASAGPPPQDPWAAQAPNQQQNRPGAPGGAPVCRCGQQMAHTFTKGQNKGVWRCPSWRWNSGSPTPDHDQIYDEDRK